MLDSIPPDGRSLAKFIHNHLFLPGGIFHIHFFCKKKIRKEKKENAVIFLSLASTSPSAPTASTAPTAPVTSITSVATPTATRVAGLLLLLDDINDFFGDP